jgi:hypothetical protein
MIVPPLYQTSESLHPNEKSFAGDTGHLTGNPPLIPGAAEGMPSLVTGAD